MGIMVYSLSWYTPYYGIFPIMVYSLLWYMFLITVNAGFASSTVVAGSASGLHSGL